MPSDLLTIKYQYYRLSQQLGKVKLFLGYLGSNFKPFYYEKNNNAYLFIHLSQDNTVVWAKYKVIQQIWLNKNNIEIINI